MLLLYILYAITYQNEPHGAATWGLNEPTTDWNKAAERIVQGIVKKVPTFDKLIFVEGVASDSKRWLTPPPPDYQLTDPAAIQVHTVYTCNIYIQYIHR
jgi:Cellulase (glycosyl hydrolase family 5)